jgi:hypothetical protein
MAGLCLEGHNPAMRIANLPRKLHRFGALSLADKWLLLRAAGRLLIARLQLGFTPFERLAAGLATIEGDNEPDPDVLSRVGYAISAAAANVPWRSDCFPQAIAARALLRGYDYASTVHMGVDKAGDDELVAHAWLTCGHTVVTGGAQMDHYAEIHRLGE